MTVLMDVDLYYFWQGCPSMSEVRLVIDLLNVVLLSCRAFTHNMVRGPKPEPSCSKGSSTAVYALCRASDALPLRWSMR